MEYSKIKKLANNYFYESAFWDTKEDFLNEFNIIDSKDIKAFDFLYKIECNKNNREKIITELLPIFQNNAAVKFVNIKDDTRIIIFHPCTRENYKYQLSWFDKFGAIMDEKYNTIDETINNYMHYNKDYKIMEAISA